MTTPKATQIAKDIDSCRCRGNWEAIPELARRYRKHNPEGAVLEKTILAEASLANLVGNAHDSASFFKDSPTHITLPPRLTTNQVRPIQNQLESVLQISTGSDNHTTKELAKVILARTYHESGEFEKALEYVDQLKSLKPDVKTGYNFILFLQARVIKAICLELTGNIEDALVSYEDIASFIDSHEGQKEPALVEWAEDALYRGTLLGLREMSQSTPNILSILRAYQDITTTQNFNWRMHKRMVISRHSLRFLSDVYRQGNYSPPKNQPIETTGLNGAQLERQLFAIEVSSIHIVYEKMLYTGMEFPRSGEVNKPVLDYVDQLAEDFKLIGGSSIEFRAFIEALDRAAQHTFNSPRITRHLFNTLVLLGEYEEAEHALHSYMYLVGLTSQAWEEDRSKGVALATDAQGHSIPIPNFSATDDEEDQEMASHRSIEHESIDNVLGVLLKAVKIYCNELNLGVRAVEMAEMALRKLREINQELVGDEEWTDLGGKVYRSVGVAYSLLATQTSDPALRPTYHEKAVHYLTKSIDIDPNAWESHYQLALEQAYMRDVLQAIQSITKSIQANPGHLPSWQLLTLACSCPVRNDISYAIKVCDMGLQESQIDASDDNQTNASGYSGGTKNTLAGYAISEQHISLQITQSLLLNATLGAEAALQSQENIFTSYSKIAIPDYSMSSTSLSHDPSAAAYNNHKIVVSGSFGNLSEIQLAAEQKMRRGRSSSNVSSIGSMVDQPRMTPDGSSPSYPGGGFLGSRARSTSSVNGRQDRSLGVSPVESENEHKTHHGLHLFGSRSSGRRARKEIPEGLWNEKNATMSKQSVADSRNLYPMGGSSQSFNSLAPSLTSTRSLFQPSSLPTRPTTRARLRIQRSHRVLSNLWLLTASYFLQLGKLEEASKAIEEAENVEWTTSPHVWCMLGRLRLAQGHSELATEAFQKGLVADSNDVDCKVWLAKTYIENNDLEIAEGLLDSVTKSNGWDSAEAWFYLGEVYRQTNRLEQTKDCLFYALDLENTRPIQPFSILPRHV